MRWLRHGKRIDMELLEFDLGPIHFRNEERFGIKLFKAWWNDILLGYETENYILESVEHFLNSEVPRSGIGICIMSLSEPHTRIYVSENSENFFFAVLDSEGYSGGNFELNKNETNVTMKRLRRILSDHIKQSG